MTTGDKLWSDNGSRAELHIGSASLSIGGTTGFSLLNLTDEVAQLQVTEGTLRVRVKRLDPSETFEIDTPNLAFSILRPGTYRINVNESGDTTVVSVFGGEGEVTGGGQAYSVHANETATFSGTDQLNADVQGLAGYDDFDQWCAQRDRREDHSSSARYVSPDVIGYEDLDDYGGWRDVPEYGTIWFPHTTVVGWAPYRYGHWAYISPWGYTWVEDEPWGFAPFHYGRWVAVGGVWGWVPCRPAVVGVVYVRPVYAPALVAWVGGPHFAVGIGVGGGVGVGWFPLGPREVYVPSYRVSRTYVNNVNISNTTVNTTVVNNYYNTTVVNKNVTNVTYVNQRVPGAVTATSTTAFTSAQPVARNMVKVDQKDVVSAPVTAGAPAVPPARQSVLGSGQVARVRPPASMVTRAVVAKTPPPPPPPTFERQQVAIRQNGGQPLGISQQRQLQSANVQAAAQPNVKIAPPARTVTPVPPRNVQVNRPVTPPNAQAVQPNNNRPNTVPPNVPASASSGPPANGRHTYNDRPPTSQPPPKSQPPTSQPLNVNPRVNPQFEQKQQQQVENLRKQQDQERQRIEQQQVREQQKLQQQHVDEQKQQQSQQKQQHQLEQVERKHDVQQQKLEEKQQREVQHAPPPPRNDRPPKNEKDKPAKP
jgi:hypothetical protein